MPVVVAAAGPRSMRLADRYLMLDPVSPVYSLSSPDYFAEAVGRAAEYGFTDTVIYWPRQSGRYAGDKTILEG